jgi:hypothetical protein
MNSEEIKEEEEEAEKEIGKEIEIEEDQEKEIIKENRIEKKVEDPLLHHQEILPLIVNLLLINGIKITIKIDLNIFFCIFLFIIIYYQSSSI